MIKSQAEQRRPQTMKDQHGRPWFADIEKASGMPTGVVRALFLVPDKRLIPPQKYLVFSTENPGTVRIDYDAWVQDLRVAAEDWEQRRMEHVNALPGGAKNPLLPKLVGPKPMSPLPVVAMRQGNTWALGVIPPPGLHGQALADWRKHTPQTPKPPEAHEFFPDPVTIPDTPVFSETVFTEGDKPKKSKTKVEA